MKTRRRSTWKRRLQRLRRALRPWWGTIGVLVLGYLVYQWVTRPEPPPKNPDDLCAIFEEKRHWYGSSRRAADRWGVPEAVQMAVIYQESTFRARVRPPRKWYLWILPGPRASTAYGYTQALDRTWESFREKADRPAAQRDRFDDAAHFVSWYGHRIREIAGIAPDDAYRLYLAYHEGPGGFQKGSHHAKGWLLETARKVEERATRYQRQLDGCRDRLEHPFPWFWFLLVLALALWGFTAWRRRRSTTQRKRPRRRRKKRS